MDSLPCLHTSQMQLGQVGPGGIHVSSFVKGHRINNNIMMWRLPLKQDTKYIHILDGAVFSHSRYVYVYGNKDFDNPNVLPLELETWNLFLA